MNDNVRQPVTVNLNMKEEDIKKYLAAYKGQPPNLAPYKLMYHCKWF